MSPDNLIEIARQADAILGDQDDGFVGFETQMRRALARSYPVGADAIEFLVDDIDAAMCMCGHELIRSRDDGGNLHYRIGEVISTEHMREAMTRVTPPSIGHWRTRHGETWRPLGGTLSIVQTADSDLVEIEVSGEEYADGRIERYVTVDDFRLNAGNLDQWIETLVAARDEIKGLES
jgi:hypothetical protein